MTSRITFILSVGFILCQAPLTLTSQIDDAMKYLSQFGYVRKSQDSKLSSISHENIFKEAIREFQEFANLKITGELNNDTIRMMKTPRCGVKDKKNPKPLEHIRFRRYVLHGSRWNTLDLTYRITKYPSQLGKSETDGEIRRAFGEWSKISPLTFSQKTSGRAHIEIRFESGDHDDEDPFDGPGGTLAHARFPSGGGHVHFDDDEVWTVKYPRQRHSTDLFRVAVHEFGHSLGLEHSKVRGAIMYPFYTGAQSTFEFHPDDINGIQAIYGEKENTYSNEAGPPSRSKPADIPIDPNTNDADNDLCKDGKLDTIFDCLDGSIYILKGSSYWILRKTGLVPGYPKPISEKWIDLPSNIDAAFNGLNGKMYFFKGSKYWRYGDEIVDKGYPKEISQGFEGIPNNIDAAFWVHHSNQGFFFKGEKYWVFDANEDVSVKSSYPKSITNFKGVPGNLDDAFTFGGRVFFFKSGWFYIIRDYALEYETSSMPALRRNAQISMFQCF